MPGIWIASSLGATMQSATPMVWSASQEFDHRSPYTVAMDKALLATRPIGMNQAVVEVPAIGDPVVRRGRIPDPRTTGPASSR